MKAISSTASSSSSSSSTAVAAPIDVAIMNNNNGSRSNMNNNDHHGDEEVNHLHHGQHHEGEETATSPAMVTLSLSAAVAAETATVVDADEVETTTSTAVPFDEVSCYNRDDAHNGDDYNNRCEYGEEEEALNPARTQLISSSSPGVTSNTTAMTMTDSNYNHNDGIHFQHHAQPNDNDNDDDDDDDDVENTAATTTDDECPPRLLPRTRRRQQQQQRPVQPQQSQGVDGERIAASTTMEPSNFIDCTGIGRGISEEGNNDSSENDGATPSAPARGMGRVSPAATSSVASPLSSMERPRSSVQSNSQLPQTVEQPPRPVPTTTNRLNYDHKDVPMSRGSAIPINVNRQEQNQQQRREDLHLFHNELPSTDTTMMMMPPLSPPTPQTIKHLPPFSSTRTQQIQPQHDDENVVVGDEAVVGDIEGHRQRTTTLSADASRQRFLLPPPPPPHHSNGDPGTSNSTTTIPWDQQQPRNHIPTWRSTIPQPPATTGGLGNRRCRVRWSSSGSGGLDHDQDDDANKYHRHDASTDNTTFDNCRGTTSATAVGAVAGHSNPITETLRLKTQSRADPDVILILPSGRQRRIPAFVPQPQPHPPKQQPQKHSTTHPAKQTQLKHYCDSTGMSSGLAEMTQCWSSCVHNLPDDDKDAAANKIDINNNNDDEYDDIAMAFLKNSGLANRRVHVSQLWMIGFVGLLLGWLGNFFVSTSCNFVELDVPVGQRGSDLYAQLHFGLWKYSPADSAMNGYRYCYPYSGRHGQEAPIMARVANLAALSAGTYSLAVLWWYLIAGPIDDDYDDKDREREHECGDAATTEAFADAPFLRGLVGAVGIGGGGRWWCFRRQWRRAVQAAFIAGLLQASTLAFVLMGRLCHSNNNNNAMNGNGSSEYDDVAHGYDNYNDDDGSSAQPNTASSTCALGPASLWTIVTAMAWIFLGYELNHHQGSVAPAPTDGINSEKTAVTTVASSTDIKGNSSDPDHGMDRHDRGPQQDQYVTPESSDGNTGERDVGADCNNAHDNDVGTGDKEHGHHHHHDLGYPDATPPSTGASGVFRSTRPSVEMTDLSFDDGLGVAGVGIAPVGRRRRRQQQPEGGGDSDTGVERQMGMTITGCRGASYEPPPIT